MGAFVAQLWITIDLQYETLMSIKDWPGTMVSHLLYHKMEINHMDSMGACIAELSLMRITMEQRKIEKIFKKWNIKETSETGNNFQERKSH